jgi:hypothetical protein
MAIKFYKKKCNKQKRKSIDAIFLHETYKLKCKIKEKKKHEKWRFENYLIIHQIRSDTLIWFVFFFLQFGNFGQLQNVIDLVLEQEKSLEHEGQNGQPVHVDWRVVDQAVFDSHATHVLQAERKRVLHVTQGNTDVIAHCLGRLPRSLVIDQLIKSCDASKLMRRSHSSRLIVIIVVGHSVVVVLVVLPLVLVVGGVVVVVVVRRDHVVVAVRADRFVIVVVVLHTRAVTAG